MAVAAEVVFGAYELLEQILLELRLRQLLLSQRINKTFHDMVQRSQGIRKALFLAPAGPVVSLWAWGGGTVWSTDDESSVPYQPVFNPFLDIAAEGRGGRSGVTHGQLIRAASMLRSKDRYLKKKKAVAFDVSCTVDWLQFRGTVDTITGLEMFDMLTTKTEELLAKDLVFHKEEDMRRLFER